MCFKIKHPSLVLIFILLSSLLRAQLASSYNFKFKNYTTQNGLVHNFTRKCCKDSKGFLWVITQNGLSRFDGVNFKNFQNKLGDKTSLPYNNILDIAIDKTDKIWLAYDKGLCYYDQKQQIFVNIRSTLNTNAVSLVYDEKDNVVWYNTVTGLFKINAGNLAITASKQQLDYHDKPYTTYLDSKRQIWTGVDRHGYYVYNTLSDTWKYYNYRDWPRNFYEDDAGKVWISTWGAGFQQFDNKEGSNANTVYNLPHLDNTFSMIYQSAGQSLPLTGKNILWVLTHTNGLALFDKEQKKFIKWIKYDPSVRSGLLSNFSTSMYTDKEGIIWICSWRGLSKINKQEQQFQSAEIPELESTNYNLLSGMADDPSDGKISWIASEGSGLAKYDKQDQKIIQWYYNKSPLKSEDIFYDWRWTKAIYKDDKKRLWVPSYGGLIKIEKGIPDTIGIKWNGTVLFLVTGKMVLENENFWIFTPQGVVKFNTDDHHCKFYRNQPATETKSLPANQFYDGAFVSKTELICASKDGLYMLNTTNGIFSRINVPSNFPNTSDRFCVVEKINNKIYIGGDPGLLEYDIITKKLTLKGADQEIYKLEINSLKKDSLGKLWIYTLNGLFRYDPSKDEFKKFTTADGIYDNSLDPVQMFTYNSNIYIGYRMAYTKYNPLKIDVNNKKVVPFITGLKISDKPQNVFLDSFARSVLNLNYTQNDIVFEFTGIDYTNSERITFAHMLEGFDKDWVMDGTTRTATYSNLYGGTYTFKVKAANSSGIWNNEIVGLKFYVKPPFWKTWWFIALVAVMFIALVVLFALYRIKKIKSKEEEKTSVNKMMAEMEMTALRSQMNPHFIFNSLNSIQTYIWENKQDEATGYLSKFSRLIRMILEYSMLKLITLEQEIEALTLYIELEHRRCNNKFDYIISVDGNIDASLILVPPLILQPYVENAIWHGLLPACKQGKLTLTINQKNSGTIMFVIEDDGIGRDAARKMQQVKGSNKTSYGMQITKQRITMSENGNLSGNVVVTDITRDDNLSYGTRITITLPIEKFEKI